MSVNHTARLLRLTIPNEPQRTLLFLRDGLTESVALASRLDRPLYSGVERGTCSVMLYVCAVHAGANDLARGAAGKMWR